MQLFVEHLTVIDSAYLHPEHGIVGESWIVDVTLHGDLDPQSMVMDFGHVKKRLKAAIDGSIDHTLIVPSASGQLTLAEEAAYVQLAYRFAEDASLTHRSPRQAVTLLDTREISDAALTSWLENALMAVVPENVSRVEIGLRHEDPSHPHYHYAHGLKKHDGNCQRIAHGHRSRVLVWKDGQRDPVLESAIAKRMCYAYLATESDQIAQADGQSHFRYTSDQGTFELHYPTERCHVLATDTTVECIAQHLAALLAAEHPGHRFTVRAYEGVHKGAIAHAG